ncbi:hypothetical protein [Desulfobacter postgatei]|uniref:hypothetical protein n=1 Tax=Desulfobacter postgatei TaxID=2293 RepID=UPI00259B837B|nr:hypothetical protein [uncultured Desulfobacter sp.]
MGTALNMRSPYIINRHPRPQIFLFPCGRGIIGKFSHTFLLHFPRLIGDYLENSHIFFTIFRQLYQVIQLFLVNVILLLDFVPQFGRALSKRKSIRRYFYKKVTGKPGVSLSTFVVGHVAVKKNKLARARYTGRRKDIV